MPESKTAFLVGILNTKTHKLDGVGVFSEPGPTMGFSHYPVVFAQVSKASYQEARDAVEALLEHMSFSWLAPLYHQRNRAG